MFEGVSGSVRCNERKIQFMGGKEGTPSACKWCSVVVFTHNDL